MTKESFACVSRLLESDCSLSTFRCYSFRLLSFHSTYHQLWPDDCLDLWQRFHFPIVFGVQCQYEIPIHLANSISRWIPSLHFNYFSLWSFETNAQSHSYHSLALMARSLWQSTGVKGHSEGNVTSDISKNVCGSCRKWLRMNGSTNVKSARQSAYDEQQRTHNERRNE